jgi:AcrR family transcriptional regulator
VQRIAEAADVHRSTIYRRFPTRESLVSALFERALEGMRSAIAAADADPDPHLGTVAALAASIVSLDTRYAFVHTHRRAHDLDDVVVDLCLFLDRLQGAGVVRSDLPPSWLAATLAALAAGGLEEVELGRMGIAEAGAAVARTYVAAVAPRA